MTELDNKKKAGLAAAIGAIEKQFGKGSIVTSETIPGVEFNSTGCLSLDRACGGGLPKGRIIEMYGPESSGKTTLALHAVAECQKKGGTAAFIDAEHALDIRYAAKVGVDVEALVMSQPDSGEQALEITEQLVRSGSVDIVVIDSVAALVPQKEIEGDMGDAQMGRQALLMSQAMRKLTGICSKTNCTIIFINQLRMKIGLVFGNPETTTGGNALKFYASLRLDIRRSSIVKTGEGDDIEAVGSRTVVKVVKNKIAPPFRDCEFTIRYGHGIDKESDILGLAVLSGLVEKKGAWYAFKGKNIGQGEANTLEAMRSDPKLLAEIVSGV